MVPGDGQTVRIQHPLLQVTLEREGGLAGGRGGQAEVEVLAVRGAVVQPRPEDVLEAERVAVGDCEIQEAQY